MNKAKTEYYRINAKDWEAFKADWNAAIIEFSQLRDKTKWMDNAKNKSEGFILGMLAASNRFIAGLNYKGLWVGDEY